MRIHGLLAPDGMEALKLAYPDLWTTLTTRLEVITDEHLADKFRTIAGAEFVTETTAALDRAHAR